MAEAAEAAESDAALHEEAGAEAHHILQTADKMSTDGKLSIIEMMTFLKNTEHEGFLEWLLHDKYHSGGKWDYHEQFRIFDSRETNDESLSLSELTEAVETWMRQGSPGLSVPHKVAPKEAQMSDAERELINFRVPGIPGVVLPPPPQKKSSIYAKPYARKPSAESMHTKTSFNMRAFDEKQKVGLRSSTGPGGLLLSSDDVAKSATGSAY